MSGETFETLLAPTLGRVRRLVNRRLRNSGHAEDVIQETLLRAFARRDQLRVDEKFGSWLCSIALNEIHQSFRCDRGTVSLDEFPNWDARDTAASPLTRFEEAERRNWVRACIAALPQRDQIVIRLQDIDGKSVREVAGALGMSQSAIKSVHFRARKRLAQVLRVRRPGRIPIRRGVLRERVDKENRIAK
jgi:RNA polymerase sigma-70 factor (ECF subfamily)